MKKSSVVIKSAVLLATLGVSMAANAGYVYTDWGTVKTLNSAGNSDITLSTTAAPINPATCAFSAYKLASDAPTFKNQYAILLTTHAAGWQVRFRIDDTNCLGGVNPQIVFIETKL